MTYKKTLIYMLISTIAFACMNVFVKYLEDFNAFQIVFFRSISSLIFTFTYLFKHKISLIGNQRKLMLLRGILGAFSMSLFFMSMKYLPVATSVSLRYLAPIFAAIFATWLLRETIKPMQWVFFSLAFLGVVILKGFDNQMNSIGLTLILVAAILTGLVYITIGKIGKNDHPVVVVNYFMIIATLVGGFFMIPYWITPKGWDWLLLLSLGVFGYYGQVYMTKAFQSGTISQVAPLKYLEVIFTLLFGVLWFHEVYTLWSLLGMSLIIGALLLNNIYKSNQS